MLLAKLTLKHLWCYYRLNSDVFLLDRFWFLCFSAALMASEPRRSSVYFKDKHVWFKSNMIRTTLSRVSLTQRVLKSSSESIRTFWIVSDVTFLCSFIKNSLGFFNLFFWAAEKRRHRGAQREWSGTTQMKGGQVTRCSR